MCDHRFYSEFYQNGKRIDLVIGSSIGVVTGVPSAMLSLLKL